MGQIMSLSCKQCGCQKTMSVGIGLMTNNPNIIASCLNGEEEKEWKRLYDSGQINYFQAEQKVFYCNNCSDLFCQLSVDAELKNGEHVTFGNKCEKCHKQLWEVKLQDNMECPICKMGNISWKQTGLWD